MFLILKGGKLIIIGFFRLTARFGGEKHFWPPKKLDYPHNSTFKSKILHYLHKYIDERCLPTGKPRLSAMGGALSIFGPASPSMGARDGPDDPDHIVYR